MKRMPGNRRPPDREPRLRETWRAVIDHIAAARSIIGGKSMGGRIGKNSGGKLAGVSGGRRRVH
jgi:predicted alpha/beta-hydrolase family hydrolase